MLGRVVEVKFDKQWFGGNVVSAETGSAGNSMTVQMLPSRGRALPAIVVVAPEEENVQWRYGIRSDNGGDPSIEAQPVGEDLPVVGRGRA